MRVLFVTPNPSGSGEAITALYMGLELVQAGHEVQYFGDIFSATFLEQAFGSSVNEMSGDPRESGAGWQNLLRGYKPHVIVFADYPLLFLSRSGRAIVQQLTPKLWGALNAELITLDHLGMAQGPLVLPFGPPHLELLEYHLPAVPEGMRILLPCPVQRPVELPEARGIPFRYWDSPLQLAPAKRKEVRERFLRDDDDLMVFHSVPTWAIGFCRRHGLPNYGYLTRLFEGFFGHLARPVVVVSVNGGCPLPASSAPGLRLINLGRLQPGDYEDLLLASDLMITDNRTSASLGRAVCGLIPCVALRNSYSLLELMERADEQTRALLLEMERDRIGCVFPFDVFPIWSRENLDTLGLFSRNPIVECMVTLEMYGGEDTRRAFEELLTAPAHREKLKAQQQQYVSSIRRLPNSEETLLSLVG
jgi:hypothetical protein